MEYAVETLSLTKVFSDFWGRRKVYAVDELNLKILPNEVFGLLGPNGSGKTTTLRLLLGLLHPTSGKAFVLGGEGADPKINCRVGFLPEESYLYRYLNARETLDFYGRLFGLPSKLRKMRIEALLDMVGLKAVASRVVGTYSKGMARRIGLAQALINDPDLLILDEPTSGLDPIGTRQIKDLIIKLAERGKTILLSSHLLADVEDVCDRIAIMYGGKIRTQGHVRELLQKSDKRQITTGILSDTTVERIKQLVKHDNAEFEISSPMDRLETYFIKIVEAAQQQLQPTSGAISTTKIGGFLAEEKPLENILDKLVGAAVTEPKPSEPKLSSVVSEGVSAPVPEPDDKLLNSLTGTGESSTQKTVLKKQPEPQPAGPQEDSSQESQVRNDILDHLTEGNDSQGSDGKQTEQSEEDTGNR